jgi:hypothetical protein
MKLIVREFSYSYYVEADSDPEKCMGNILIKSCVIDGALLISKDNKKYLFQKYLTEKNIDKEKYFQSNEVSINICRRTKNIEYVPNSIGCLNFDSGREDFSGFIHGELKARIYLSDEIFKNVLENIFRKNLDIEIDISLDDLVTEKLDWIIESSNSNNQQSLPIANFLIRAFCSSNQNNE